MNSRPPRLTHDWYPGQIPTNLMVGDDVYLDTSYGFSGFFSNQQPGLLLGKGAGAYGSTTFLVQPNGQVTVGPYTCLNSASIICSDRITIGAHCLVSWGVVLTDTWLGPHSTPTSRRLILEIAASDRLRRLPCCSEPRPVTLQDNVWVGFNAVILPGMTLGHGCVIGCNTIVDRDVPPYAVVVGNPARIVRYLEPDDKLPTRESSESV